MTSQAENYELRGRKLRVSFFNVTFSSFSQLYVYQLARLYLYLIGILRQFVDVISLRQGIGDPKLRFFFTH